MKVETPQILWHNGADSDNGKAAPLMSLSMIESGITDIESSGKAPKYGTVLVTAGNTTEINVWRLGLRHTLNAGAAPAGGVASGGILQHGPPYSTKIELMLSLNRHERTVNAVKFSPDGLHLLTAGDGGSIVVWSVPVSKRGNDNGRHYWSTLERENDLTCRVVSGASEDILDVSWSADSKRFVAGSLDHCVMVYEDACTTGSEESQWKCVYRNAKDHTHYVQGVSFDPLGVYVASMGSDRTARVYARKQPSALKTPKKKKNQNGPSPIEERALAPSDLANEQPPTMEDKEQEDLRKRENVQRVLTESKFELGKAKTLKYRYDTTGDASVEATNTTNNAVNSGKKHHLFADETTVESFFRRLSWTTDGAFLVAPAALWYGHASANNGNEAKPEHEGTTGGTVSAPTFATYLFARHRFDKPIRVLAGLEKPSVVVRPNPVLFKLPKLQAESTKENQAQDAPCPLEETAETGGRPTLSSPALAYRSIFAVLTLDSILLYDTHHLEPLCVARGLHYAGLTDCVWSPDGMNLLVTSTDGYVSILGFDDGELGEVYTPPKAKQVCPVKDTTALSSNTDLNQPTKSQALGICSPAPDTKLIPPCAPGQSTTLVEPPTKRAKKTRIAPTLISTVPNSKGKKRIAPTLVTTTTTTTTAQSSRTPETAETTCAITPDRTSTQRSTTTTAGNKRPLPTETTQDNVTQGTDMVANAVTHLSLENPDAPKQKKKKKRIQPTLVSTVL